MPKINPNNPTIIRWSTENAEPVEVRFTFKGPTAYAYRDGQRIAVGAVFDRCVWKGSDASIESRLFRTADPQRRKATLVAVDKERKKIYTWVWKRFNDDDLKTKQPTVQFDAEGIPSIVWENLPIARQEAFDLTAEDDITREQDCITIGLNLGKKGLSTTLGKTVAAVAVWKGVQWSATLASSIAFQSWAAGTTIAETTSDWFLAPAINATQTVIEEVSHFAVENVGVSGLVIGGTVAALSLADKYLSPYQINQRIQARFNAVLANFRRNDPRGLRLML
ncbi:MAG TPA: hypothetical protein VHL30_00940 [Chlamydiales bacterium]|nr:hypothetical protein [Chlamydiales bacterium]